MGTKFIRNTDDATIICKIANEAQKAAGLDTTFVFRNKKFDRSNNMLLSSGYTEVSDEDLALLEKESKTYISYRDLGRLTVVESLPLESMTPEQMLLALKSENATLKQQLMEKGGGNVEKQAAEIEQLKAELAQMSTPDIAEKMAEIDELHKTIEEMQMTIDELTAQLAEIDELHETIEEMQTTIDWMTAQLAEDK